MPKFIARSSFSPGSCWTAGLALAALGAVTLGAGPARAEVPTAPRPAKAKAGKAKAAGGTPDIAFETSLGTFVVRLFADRAPLSSDNLLQYVDAGFYDGLVFHRVIPGFMVQGGGYDADLKEKAPTRPPVRNESGLPQAAKNRRGTVAMARTGDPDSATAQFFVNVVDNPMLDAQPGRPGYAVVGEVTSGMEVVDKIRDVEIRCASRGMPQDCEGLRPGTQDVPKVPVVIKKARRQPAK